MYHIGGNTFEVLKEHKNGWNYEAFRDRYSEVLDRYDFIVGDWGYNQLRLKGFFKENNTKGTKDTSIALLQDYLNEYCNFGCAYFILEKVAGKNQGGDPGTGPAESGQGQYEAEIRSQLPNPRKVQNQAQEGAPNAKPVSVQGQESNPNQNQKPNPPHKANPNQQGQKPPKQHQNPNQGQNNRGPGRDKGQKDFRKGQNEPNKPKDHKKPKEHRYRDKDREPGKQKEKAEPAV